MYLALLSFHCHCILALFFPVLPIFFGTAFIPWWVIYSDNFSPPATVWQELFLSLFLYPGTVFSHSRQTFRNITFLYHTVRYLVISSSLFLNTQLSLFLLSPLSISPMCLNIFATSGKVEELSVGSPPGTLAPLMNFEAFVQIFIFLFPSDGPETSERSEQISLFFPNSFLCASARLPRVCECLNFYLQRQSHTISLLKGIASIFSRNVLVLSLVYQILT